MHQFGVAVHLGAGKAGGERLVGIALDASGPDGGPVVVDRRPAKLSLTHSPLPASQLEGLLRETAARAA